MTIYTPDEFAELLKLSRRTVVQLCADGRIPGARKVGRQWRIPGGALEQMFEVPEAQAARRPPAPRSADRPKRRREILNRLRKND